MTSVLNAPEIFQMIVVGLFLGGITGALTGLVINRVRSRFKQTLKSSLLLGILGYWAGAYVSSLIAQFVAGNGAVVQLYLAAALAGAVMFTVIGSIVRHPHQRALRASR